MSRKNQKGRGPKGTGPPDGTDADDSVEDEEAASFADLMSDTRRIQPGPQRVAVPPAASPAVARSLGAKSIQGVRSASGPDAATGTSRIAAFRWPDPADRSRAAADGVSDITLFGLGRGEPAPDERIDLHGVRRDAARHLVAKRLGSARARGLRCVLIVHGHGKHSGSGETVLKEALPGWLSKRPCAESVLAFAPAPRNLGGEGATMVLICRR